jgi:hypothetical protein
MKVLAVRGKVKPKGPRWRSWLEYAEETSRLIGYEATHIAVRSESLRSDKVLNLDRLRGRVMNAVERGERFEWLSLYSLPPGFSSATFDYKCLLVRSLSFAAVISERALEGVPFQQRMIEELQRFIACESVEVFEMERSEVPLLYLWGARAPESFSTLNVLEQFPLTGG